MLLLIEKRDWFKLKGSGQKGVGVWISSRTQEFGCEGPDDIENLIPTEPLIRLQLKEGKT